MDLKPYTRVACLGDEQDIKGLQWFLDHEALYEKKYQLFSTTLSKLSSEEAPSFDFIVLILDLGQIVPIENLKKLAPKPGLCVFMQPTPQQLLSLGELQDWFPLAWDKAHYEKLAKKMDDLASTLQKKLHLNAFVESAEKWALDNSKNPSIIELINVPSGWPGPRFSRLNTYQGFVLVGGQESSAEIKLPVPGVDHFGEFRLLQGNWVFKSLSPRVKNLENEALKSGQHIEILGYELLLSGEPLLRDFIKLAQRYEIFDLRKSLESEDFASKNLEAVCRELLFGHSTGELRLSSSLKHGSIFFNEGYIVHAVTGAVRGIKALLRMFSWGGISSDFQVGVRPDKPALSFGLNLVDFTQLYRRWSKEWPQISSVFPPTNVKLKINPKNFLTRTQWTKEDYLVAASVSEFSLVRDILNNCPLNDVETVKSLVNLRRQGLVEPIA